MMFGRLLTYNNFYKCALGLITPRTHKISYQTNGIIMKISQIPLVLVFLFIPSLSSADTASEKEAEKLLNLIGMEEVFAQSISQMLDVELQHDQALAPYRSVMLEFFSKYVSYQSMKPELLKIYSEAFTADELREIRGFYATDTGKKTLEKMPTLMAESSQIGMMRVQENIAELYSMIEAESKRIQSLQSKQ